VKKGDLIEWIDLGIKEIKEDDRFKAKRDLNANLPLFILQTEMAAKLSIFEKIKNKLMEE
jgi:hypothetical protein